LLTTKHTKHTKSGIVDFWDGCRTQNPNLRTQILGFLALRALCELCENSDPVRNPKRGTRNPEPGTRN